MVSYKYLPLQSNDPRLFCVLKAGRDLADEYHRISTTHLYGAVGVADQDKLLLDDGEAHDVGQGVVEADQLQGTRLRIPSTTGHVVRGADVRSRKHRNRESRMNQRRSRTEG